jgi:hypothetical protein
MMQVCLDTLAPVAAAVNPYRLLKDPLRNPPVDGAGDDAVALAQVFGGEVFRWRLVVAHVATPLFGVATCRTNKGLPKWD